MTDGADQGIIISDEQFGKKAGKHMTEWGLDPANADDRAEFMRLTRDIVSHAEEVRKVEWLKDIETGHRTQEATAYIKGNDVVLSDNEHNYITTMKDGINNTRVRNGKKEEPGK